MYYDTQNTQCSPTSLTHITHIPLTYSTHLSHTLITHILKTYSLIHGVHSLTDSQAALAQPRPHTKNTGFNSTPHGMASCGPCHLAMPWVASGVWVGCAMGREWCVGWLCHGSGVVCGLRVAGRVSSSMTLRVPWPARVVSCAMC